MKQRLFRMRRWGVAALAGVTVLGAASVVGEGVASATTTAISAALATGSTAVTVLPTGTATTNLTFTLTGAPAGADEIVLTATPAGGACSSTNYVEFTSGTVTGTGWTTPSAATAGNCGTATNVLTITGSSGATTSVTAQLNFSSKGAATGAAVISGSYILAAGGSIPFTVPTILTVQGLTVTGNSPAVTVGANAADQAISNVTITEPTVAAIPVDYVCVTLPQGFTFATQSTPSVTVPTYTGATVATTSSSTAGTTASVAFSPGDSSISFYVAHASTVAATYTLSNLAVNTPSTATVGAAVATVYDGATAPTCTSYGRTITAALTSASSTLTSSNANFAGSDIGSSVTGTDIAPGTTISAITSATVATMSAAATGTVGSEPVVVGAVTGLGSAVGSGTVFSSQSTSQPYQGATPEATTADEFMGAYPNGNSTVVLATAADPYDALDASYLESRLATGLLITPPTSLDPNTMLALRLEGVKTVYVVGGPLAISQTVISQLQSTPAYNFGGTQTTGSNLVVEPAIYGPTADDTAQKIDAMFPAASVPSFDLSNAYSAATASSGGGAYNDTIGSASAAPTTAGSLRTAIVVSDTDYQDAMAASVLAYKAGMPIILTPPTGLGTQATATLSSLGIQQVILLGGQLALPNTIVSQIQALPGSISVLRIAGQIASDTAQQIANFELAAAPSGMGYTATSALVAQGSYWSDALSAAALGGNSALNSGTSIQPLILTVNPTTVGQYTTAFLNAAGSAAGVQGSHIGSLTFLGGPLALPATTVAALNQALAAG